MYVYKHVFIVYPPQQLVRKLSLSVTLRDLAPQVTSSMITVKGDARKGRVIEIGADGIPIIHGVRVPDDPSDTQIYRNARYGATAEGSRWLAVRWEEAKDVVGVGNGG